MLKKFILPIVGAVAGIALGASSAMAAVSAAEAAKLGAELTPLGGQKAGNADGSIPAWDGGLTSAWTTTLPHTMHVMALPGAATVKPIRSSTR